MSSKKTDYLKMHDWTEADPWRLAEVSENFKKMDKKAKDLDTSMAATVSTATDAKTTATGIDAKATDALTKSTEAAQNVNTAVQKANSAETKATEAKTVSDNALAKAGAAESIANGVQTQFNQVVINGDSSVEAAQARVNISGQTYSTLKQRLDSEHQEVTVKLAETAKKDEILDMATKGYVTEQIVNVNTNGTVDISAKADTAYVDKLATVAIKQPLTNIVTNGDFSKGVTNWTLANLTYVLENQVLKATATSQYARLQRAISYETGDIVYRTALVKTTSNLVALGAASSAKKFHSGSGLFERLSHVGIENSNKYISVVDTRTANWDQIEVDNLLAINLTATFGAGNEPTLSEMDSILQNYYKGWFDGTADMLNKSIDDVKESIEKVDSSVRDLGVKVGQVVPYNAKASVAITFDDGFKNNFTVAHPLLKERGLPATLFIASDWVLNSDGTGGWMSPNDALQMQAEGWEIGAHSKTHPNHANLTDEQVRQEASLSKEALKAAGFDISTYALPYGAIPVNRNILPEYFDHIAQSGSAINTLPLPKYIYRYFPTNEAGTTVNQVLELIRDAEKRGGVVILGFHRIDDDISGNAWRTDKFTALLDALDADKVFTFRDIAKAKAPASLKKLNKSHYQWGWSDSITNPIYYPIGKGFGWDYTTRSLGIDLKKPKKLKQVRVKGIDTSVPMIDNNNLEVWYSSDNVTFTKHTGGFTFYHYVDSRLEDLTRSILIEVNNPVQARYWKFHQTLNHTVNKTKVDPTNIYMDAWTEQTSINF